LWTEFEGFISRFNRVYATHDILLAKFAAFKDNMATAAKLNAMHEGTATFGVTKFSDLTADEFRTTLLTARAPNASDIVAMAPTTAASSYPSSLDWNAEGMVTPVKDQGACGCCWAFSAMAELESRLLRASYGTYALSPQQLVDCDTSDSGCNGGVYTNAWAYIYTAGGAESWSNYPFTGTKGRCKFNPSYAAASLASSTAVGPANTPVGSPASSSDIYAFVYAHGPASAALDATPLQSYTGGIIGTSACGSGDSINHAILISGFDANNDYFSVKNSWGTDWGEDGFFRIRTEACLINTYVAGSN